MVRGFTPDGRILFVTTQGQPFFRNYRAFTLGVDGGLPELLPTDRSTTCRTGRAGRRSSAATPPIRRAGSAIAAALPATCGSTPRATTASGG